MHLARHFHLFTVLEINNTQTTTHLSLRTQDLNVDPGQSDSDRSQTTEFVRGSVHRSTHFILPEPGPIFQDHGCDYSLCCRQTNVWLVRVWAGQECAGCYGIMYAAVSASVTRSGQTVSASAHSETLFWARPSHPCVVCQLKKALHIKISAIDQREWTQLFFSASNSV